jgi:hypothetical protein
MIIRWGLSKNLLVIIVIFAFLCASIGFSILVIKDFSVPLTGWVGIGTDPTVNYDYVDYWEYMGFYFSENLNLTPIPHLNIVNNQVFYPYGVNTVFQSWGFERDIFYAICSWLFGRGPWLQTYYLLTLIITAIGTFLLLVRDYGFFRSIGAGFILSFGNFYAIHKYPHHLNIAVIHWTTLSFIADFLIVKRVALRQPVSLKLILVRFCLLILSLGQDLGYIAGFTLMSFTISTLFIATLTGYRYYQKELNLITVFSRTVALYKKEFFSSPYIFWLILAAITISSYLYIPLVLQIAREAKSFDFTGMFSGSWWANPLRLLIPFFPFFNPSQSFLEQGIGDLPETFTDASIGWFLIIMGMVGLWQMRRKIFIFLPLLIILLLCLFYHPLYIPTLKIFPWFAFNRVGGRSTAIYPIIFCIFALHINLNGLRLRSKQWLSALLVLLACTEFYTAYSFKSNYQPQLLDNNFFTYMDYVKEQPGEAVLDWPFCIHGGNGIGICPYYRYNSGVYTMRRFHEKKVIGQYFGRLHPSQIEPYLQAGWDKLFFPDDSYISMSEKPRQARCFQAAEWSFFTDFYKLNDFAGINLYIELLPEDCASEFYARFGSPAVETVIPGAGRVQFIPKSAELRNQVNLSLGSSLKFDPLLEISDSNHRKRREDHSF